jgi:hypothetical protein
MWPTITSTALGKSRDLANARRVAQNNPRSLGRHRDIDDLGFGTLSCSQATHAFSANFASCATSFLVAGVSDLCGDE